MEQNIFCEICQNRTNQNELGKFTKHHLIKYHNITSKEYYDLFYKKEIDGICKTCGNSTNFRSMKKGYADFCSNACVLKNKEIKNISTEKRCNQEKETFGCCYIQTEEYKSKSKKTKKEKYGDEKYCNKEQISKTCKEKYGVTNFFQSKEFRIIMEDRGLFIPINQKTDFEIYRMNVLNETKKWKNELLEKWDGKDYYNEKVLLTDRKDFNNPLYRTVDHKISIYEGFQRNISYLKIGNIKNLCVCSRSNNSKKKNKNRKDWLQQIKFFNPI